LFAVGHQAGIIGSSHGIACLAAPSFGDGIFVQQGLFTRLKGCWGLTGGLQLGCRAGLILVQSLKPGLSGTRPPGPVAVVTIQGLKSAGAACAFACLIIECHAGLGRCLAGACRGFPRSAKLAWQVIAGGQGGFFG
jgi:hypothetical protein